MISPSSDLPKHSVAIVGSGVAGAAAAIRLAELGVPVELYEAVAEPQPIGAGLLLQPTGQQVLQAMGLLDGALALGHCLGRLFGDTPTGRTVLDMSYQRLDPDYFGLGIQRGALMGLLWQRLQQLGVPWHRGAAVDGFEQDAAGVTLRFAKPRPAPARHAALILANGSFSRLRSQMKIRQHARTFPWGAVWTVLPVPEGFALNELRQRFRAARQMLGLMPVGRPHPQGARGINLFWSLPLTELAHWRDTPGLDGLKRQMAELFPAAAPVIDGLHDASQLREARYADVWMERWHDGRVLAIGDCAHGMSPQLGQGANLALIDAHVLAQQATAGGDWPAVFARYSHHRSAHLRFYSQASRGLTPMFQSHATVAPWLRDQFFGWGGRLPFIQKQSIATLAGTKTGWLFGRLKL